MSQDTLVSPSINIFSPDDIKTRRTILKFNMMYMHPKFSPKEKKNNQTKQNLCLSRYNSVCTWLTCIENKVISIFLGLIQMIWSYQIQNVCFWKWRESRRTCTWNGPLTLVKYTIKISNVCQSLFQETSVNKNIYNITCVSNLLSLVTRSCLGIL